MYKLKQRPEDFIVKEISNVKISRQGRFTYFLLKKTDHTTIWALDLVSRKINKTPKKMGFAGNKDKIAVTEQVCSVPDTSDSALERVDLKGIEIKVLGRGNIPVSLGDLDGNSFEITVRNISELPQKKEKFVNYFGEQRFSNNNKDIGKAIVQGSFKKAVELILGNKGDIENKVKRYLEDKPNDFIGAMRTINKKILRMFVHAYQSFIWNMTASVYFKRYGAVEVKIPIFGFGTEIEDDKVEGIITSILEREGVDERDFIIKSVPELSAEGDYRDLIAKAHDLKIGELEDDELNDGMKKLKIKFWLNKGTYATEFIRQLFS